MQSLLLTKNSQPLLSKKINLCISSVSSGSLRKKKHIYSSDLEQGVFHLPLYLSIGGRRVGGKYLN